MKLRDELVDLRREWSGTLNTDDNRPDIIRVLDFIDAVTEKLQEIIEQSPKRHDADCGYIARRLLAKLNEEA